MAKSIQKSQILTKSTSIRALEPDYVPGSKKYASEKSVLTDEYGVTVQTLYDTVAKSPEVMACITALIEDIMADGWRFNSVVKSGKSKSAIDKAVLFQEKSKFYSVLTNALLDLFITGDAYILKLSVSEDQIKSVIDKLTTKMAKSMHVEINKDTIYELVNQDLIDSAEKIKDLQLMKASTVVINFDETAQIVSYEQRVQGKSRVWKPADVIHLTFMNVGGQPYGFTPLGTLLSDIATLIFAKEYAGKYFENDGIPTFMFQMPKEHPGSPNYEKLKSELKELRKQTNKWKSLVLTGEIDYKEIQKWNKDMEFAKLISHFTQIILMAYGVPAHRVNLTIDVRQIGGAVNRAYEGYYKKINFNQQCIQEVLNRDLWINFKVRMQFKETYKIDELREAQIVQILAQIGSHTISELREKMGDEPELPKGEMPTKTSPTFGNADTDTNQMKDTQDENKVKEKLDNKLKSINDDSLLVKYGDFVVIVENKVGSGRFQKANVLYMEVNDAIFLFFNDGNWKYKTKVDKSRVKEQTGLTLAQFRVEVLGNAIKLFM